MVVTHVVMARLFGAITFGTYQACAAIVEMLTRAGTGGAEVGVLRYVAGLRASGREAEVDRAIGTALRLCWGVASSLVAGTVLLALVRGGALFGASVATALPWIAPAAVLSGTTLILVQASLAARAPRANLIVRGIGEPVLLLAAALAAWRLSGGVKGLAMAHLAAAILTVVLAFVVVGTVFGGARLARTIFAGRLRGLATFSLPLGMANMLNTVHQRADLVILTHYAGVQAAAFFAAAEFITRAITNVRYAFDSIATGLFSEALELTDKRRLHYNLALMIRWVTTATLPLGFTVIVLRRDLLALYGPPFVAATGALVVLAVAQIVSGCFGLTGYYLVAAGRSRLTLLFHFGGAVLNVSCGLILIPRFGLMGAAITALLTVVGLQLGLFAALWSLERIHPFEARQLKPAVAASAAGAAQLLMPQFRPVALHIVAVIVVGLGVTLAVLLALGLPAEERQMLARVRRGRAAGR
jgi:O-antigen/teichoic acid export membrane protein